MSTLDLLVVALYFLFILGFGSVFARYATTTHEFFFAGRRFAWWVVAISCISMVVGSYSFIKYSAVAYQYGISSTQTYLNDWMLLPFWLFGWFPIIYYSRIRSIPEYMERRFDRSTRHIMTALLLLYMIGYIGINVYTMGVAINALMPWSVFGWAAVSALVTAVYVSSGGQHSVIMTDLVQGFLLIVAGLLLFALGLDAIGGLAPLWDALPPDHRKPFSPLTSPPDFSAVGIFWQDGLANTGAFYFLNQGFIMRFLSVRSEADGRKAMFAVALFLMPLVAISVSAAGWVAPALQKVGLLGTVEPKEVFIRVTEVLCQPGLFGFVIAALIAALMSSVDALINAVSAIFVNDIWRLHIRPSAPDSHHLKVARLSSLAASAFGLALVPLFSTFQSIYSAHAMFTAAITPPLVSVIFLAFLWRRFTTRAAIATMVCGTAAIAFSFLYPQVIAPFAHGVAPGGEHAHAFVFMRALYGLVVSLFFGVVVSLLDKPSNNVDPCLVIGPIAEKRRLFKGGEPNLNLRRPLLLVVHMVDEPSVVRLAKEDALRLGANPGDHLYISDPRSWLGGLRSVHAPLSSTDGSPGGLIIGKDLVAKANFSPGRPVKVWVSL